MKKFRKTYSLIAISAGVFSLGQCFALGWEMMAALGIAASGATRLLTWRLEELVGGLDDTED